MGLDAEPLFLQDHMLNLCRLVLMYKYKSDSITLAEMSVIFTFCAFKCLIVNHLCGLIPNEWVMTPRVFHYYSVLPILLCFTISYCQLQAEWRDSPSVVPENAFVVWFFVFVIKNTLSSSPDVLSPFSNVMIDVHKAQHMLPLYFRLRFPQFKEPWAMPRIQAKI